MALIAASSSIGGMDAEGWTKYVVASLEGWGNPDCMDDESAKADMWVLKKDGIIKIVKRWIHHSLAVDFEGYRKRYYPNYYYEDNYDNSYVSTIFAMLDWQQIKTCAEKKYKPKPKPRIVRKRKEADNE